MTTMRYHTCSLVSILYPFCIENSISVLIDRQQINHLTVGTRSVRQTNITISSPHLGFGIQIKPRGKVSEPSYQRNDIRMTSDKVGNCYHESQQLDGRTRFLSFGFRYENDMRLWMFEHCRWMAATHFFTGLTTASNYSTVASDSFKLFRWVLYKTKATPSWVSLKHLLQNPFP